MLRDFFPGSIISRARTWDFLTRIDAAETDCCRRDGCPHCGSCLDSASYPRKPHGLAVSPARGCSAFQFLLPRLPRPADAGVGALFQSPLPPCNVV